MPSQMPLLFKRLQVTALTFAGPDWLPKKFHLLWNATMSNLIEEQK
jgi:hypothetical protein